MEEYSESGNKIATHILDTTTVYNKESGQFYYPEQVVYRLDKPDHPYEIKYIVEGLNDTVGIEYFWLNEDNVYKLVIRNPQTGKEITSETPLVKDFRITKPGGRIKFTTPHYTNPDWNCDPTHKNHFSSYSFQTFDAERRHFDFYSEINLRPVKRYVTTLNLWKALGLEFLINIDHKYPSMRFFRKFWEHYLCYILRGKDMYFEFEVIKED